MPLPLVKLICAAAAANYSVSPDDLRGRIRRRSPALRARMVAIHLARDVRAASLPALAAHFCIDHTTVLHHQRKARKLIDAGDYLREEVSDTLEILDNIRLRRNQVGPSEMGEGLIHAQ